MCGVNDVNPLMDLIKLRQIRNSKLQLIHRMDQIIATFHRSGKYAYKFKRLWIAKPIFF